MAVSTWKSISEHLRKQIEQGDLLPGTKLPTEEQLAGQWGVSRQTIHRSVHELQRIGLVIRQRRWGTVVSDPTSKKTGRIALVIDKFAQVYNFPQADLLRGLQDGLGDEFNLICCECKGDPQRETQHLRKMRLEADGIVICPTADASVTPVLQEVIDAGTPLVVLDRVPTGLECDAVVSDNEGATLRAIRALESSGHTRIGFLSFYKPDFSTVHERYAAYQKAMAEVGLENVTEFVRWFPRELESYPEMFVQSLYDSLFTLLNDKEPITALFCVQDSLAAAGLQACDHMGLSVPAQLELATFNDWPPMMLRRPWQTHRIVQNSYQIGIEAASILHRRISGSMESRRVIHVDAEFHVADVSAEPAFAGVPTPMSNSPKTNGGS